MGLPELQTRMPEARGWRRIHIVGLLCSLTAGGVIFGLFNRFGHVERVPEPRRELVASVDLRIGNPAGAAERGAARARLDIEAGLLQLQVLAAGRPAELPGAAEAARWKQRYGITWQRKREAVTPLTEAAAEGYNRVMRAEIERRHGPDVLRELLQALALPADPPTAAGPKASA